MDRPGVGQVAEGSGEQGKMEETGCEIICGAPTTLAVKEQMMMMMMKWLFLSANIQFFSEIKTYHDLFVYFVPRQLRNHPHFVTATLRYSHSNVYTHQI